MPTITPDHVAFILSDEGALLREDVLAWGEWYGPHGFFQAHALKADRDDADYLVRLYDKLFVIFPEFRSLSDFRTAGREPLNRFASETMKRGTELHIQCARIGPRLRIQHGQNTYVLARSIGSDFWVNHNVTIGANGGVPVIGDRVTVRTGAVVVGPISIGDDCVITANAVVSRDMPAGHVAYAPRTVIRPRRTHEP